MRLPAVLLTLPVLGIVATAPAVPAEATRTLRAELSDDALSHFAVENLVGTMRIAPAAVKTVVVVATVHAESGDLASSVKLQQVTGKAGVPTLRVVYPLDEEDVLRYTPKGTHSGFFDSLFEGSGSTIEYDHHKVRIVGRGGVLLYADLEVQIPRRLQDALFRNLVGTIQAKDLEGKVKLDAASGDINLAGGRGEISTDTGSGNVKASDLTGSFSCDTGSGDCDLTDFDGETILCHVGSGDVTIREVSARRSEVTTGSGDVHLIEGDIEEIRASTGSGDVHLESRGSRLSRVVADTGSGNVVLRLAESASFEALADQGSGDIIMGFKDAQAIVRHKEVVGYRRGDARIKIDVDTGSGDLTIEPGA